MLYTFFGSPGIFHLIICCEGWEPTTKFKDTVHSRLPSFLILIARSEVLKTTQGFDNLLERLTELTGSCYTHGYGLLQGKDIDWNQPRKRNRGQRPGEAKCAVSVELYSPGIHLWQYTQSMTNQESSPKHRVPNFYWGSIMWAQLLKWLITQVHWYHMTQRPHLTWHCGSFWPKSSQGPEANKDTPIRHAILELNSRKMGTKARTLLGRG